MDTPLEPAAPLSHKLLNVSGGGETYRQESDSYIAQKCLKGILSIRFNLATYLNESSAPHLLHGGFERHARLNVPET